MTTNDAGRGTKSDLSPGFDFLLKEYDQLYAEIRNIHDKKIAFFKLFITYVIALLAYIVSGVVFYVKSKADPHYPIPPTMAYGYSILGIILTSAVYSLVHNASFYLGPSKKSTVRMWRAIHQIRRAFKESFPQIQQYILMPDGTEVSPRRPRLSGRWELGALIFPLYHTMFFILLVLLLVPFFSTIDPILGVVVSDTDPGTLIAPMVYLFPFLILRLAIGNKAMRDFAANIQDARLISIDNPYPKFRERHSQKTSTLIMLMNFINVTFALFIWALKYTSVFTFLPINQPVNYVDYCISCFVIQILLGMSYLIHTKAINIEISFGRRGIARIIPKIKISNSDTSE